MVSFMSQLHINAHRSPQAKIFMDFSTWNVLEAICSRTNSLKFHDPVNARRRRKILLIFAYRMSWKRFGNKGLWWVGISVTVLVFNEFRN